MERIGPEWERRHLRNIAGIPLPKGSQYSYKTRGTRQPREDQQSQARSQGRSFGLFYGERPIDFEELVKPSLTNIVQELKSPDVELSLATVQKLSSILSFNAHLLGHIVTFLGENNVPESLADKVRPLFKGYTVSDDSWKLLFHFYKVIHTLITNDDTGIFSSSIAEAEFVEVIIEFLNNPVVLDHHHENTNRIATMVSAMKTLLSIVTRSPSFSVQVHKDVITTLRMYAKSKSVDVSTAAMQSEMTFNMIFPDGLLPGNDAYKSGVEHNSDISKTLLLCTKRENFKCMLKSSKYENDWRELSATVHALDTLSHGNAEFTLHIYLSGVVETIYKIMASADISDQVGKSQRVDFVVAKLLLVLLRITDTVPGKKSLLSYAFDDIAFGLLKSKATKDLKIKALALISILHTFRKNGTARQLPIFDCDQENTETVAEARFENDCYTEQLDAEISTFLVDSGFVEQLCTQLFDIVHSGGHASVPDPLDENWDGLFRGIKILAKSSSHSKAFVDIMHKAKIVEVLKEILLSKIFKKQKKHKNVRELIVSVIGLLNVFAYHGFQEELLDQVICDSVYSLTSCQEEDDFTEVLKLFSTSFFILMPKLRQQRKDARLPKIIDERDINGSIRLVSTFLATYGTTDLAKAIMSLSGSICNEGALKFIANDITRMIDTHPSMLPALITASTEKYVLLVMLSKCASISSNMAKEFLQSDYMRLLLRLTSDTNLVQYIESQDIMIQRLVWSFIDKNFEILSDLLVQEENVLLFDISKILPKLLPFISGKEHLQPRTVGRLWVGLASVWLAHRRRWPEKCGISATELTARITIPDTLKVINGVMVDISIESRVKCAFLDMLDMDSLVKRICKKMDNAVTRLKIHSDKEVNEELVTILDFLASFSSESENFNRRVIASNEYKMLMKTVLDATTDPRVLEVDKVSVEYSRRCLRVLLVTLEHERKKGPPDQCCIAILEKWVTCEEPEIQFLALRCLSLFPFQPSILKCIGNITELVCVEHIMENLSQFQFYGKVAVVYQQPEFPDILLRILTLLVRSKSKFSAIIWGFRRPILGGLIEAITECRLPSVPKDAALKQAVSLIWLLSTYKHNSRRLLEDSSIADALRKLLNGKLNDVETEAFCALLELTGNVQEHDVYVKDKFDVAIITPEALNPLSSDIHDALKSDGYRVIKASLSTTGKDMIGTIQSSQFLIFLFSEDTEHSELCHTAVNHAHRTNTSFIGVYIGRINTQSWEHSVVSPQNKIIMHDTSQKEVSEMLSKIRHLIPRVNLCLLPDCRQDESKFINDFDKFAEDCNIGEMFIRENFVGSVFDCNGGYLMLPTQEVVVYIPPGAIEGEKRQRVYCHGNDYKYGGIHAGKVVLSPVIHCGPNGAEFKKDVVLTFPHCAVNEKHWNFTALTKLSGGNWNELPDNTIIVKDEFVYIFLDHFTGFTAEGDAKKGQTAQRRLTIGARGTFITDTCFQIHVGVWCETGTHSDRQKVSEWQERTVMQVGDRDGIVMVTVEEVEEGWKQRGGMDIKMIRLDDLGTDKEVVVANCQHTFRYIASNKEKPEDFFGIVSVTSKENYKVTLELAVPNSTMTKPRDTEVDPRLAAMKNAELYRELNMDWDPQDSQISGDLWKRLCQLLDVPRDGNVDWKCFAGNLELESCQINRLEAGKDSPTSRLLAFYFSSEKIRMKSRGESLAKLRLIFSEMKNDVAVSYINNYMEKMSICDEVDRTIENRAPEESTDDNRDTETRTEQRNLENIAVHA